MLASGRFAGRAGASVRFLAREIDVGGEHHKKCVANGKENAFGEQAATSLVHSFLFSKFAQSSLIFVATYKMRLSCELRRKLLLAERRTHRFSPVIARDLLLPHSLSIFYCSTLLYESASFNFISTPFHLTLFTSRYSTVGLRVLYVKHCTVVL